ncbi:MAG: hypothetical protein IJA69_01005, partial [Clostridia bacterium]|nr:hypothetical protein [Clostridia bacterium]
NKDGMIGLYRSASWHVEGDYSYSLESYSGSTWYEAWHLIDAQTFESKNNAYAGGDCWIFNTNYY